MKSSDIRKELHKYVDEADTNTLKFMQEALIAYRAEKHGKEEITNKKELPFAPQSNDELIERILQSEENLKNGNYKTHEEVKKIMKTWHVQK
jgi:hypothetical protein